MVHVAILVAITTVLLPLSSGSVCLESCICSTTSDGLHRAACSNIEQLYKYTLKNKHHNINILDLSHNNITRLNNELNNLLEVVTLDLSANGLTDLSKFQLKTKKLVHLNLAGNRFTDMSSISLPSSVSSLDLSDNMFHSVPRFINILNQLEHLQMEGNPLECSCENLQARDRLISAKIHIDNVKCHNPAKFKTKSWLELKTKDVCKGTKSDLNILDMMMGDAPINALEVEQDANQLKAVKNNDLEHGEVLQGMDLSKEDDNSEFMKVDRNSAVSRSETVEGSGDSDGTTENIFAHITKTHDSFVSSETQTDSIIEGSGFEGSGYGDYVPIIVETSTEHTELYTGPNIPFILDDDTDYPTPKSPSLYEGGASWYKNEISSESYNHQPTNQPSTIKYEKIVTTESPVIHVPMDTTISEPIKITPSGVEQSQINTITPHRAGTYICIAIIVVLLVGLIGFAVVKSQIRKRRDRRLIRQQRKDVEKASKEMVDMNKSLLGKPAVESSLEKKLNGKYELVPTHDSHPKKHENADMSNGTPHPGANGDTRTDSPRDDNQNKNSSKDNNLLDEINAALPQFETSFNSVPTSNDSKRDNISLSSEEIHLPNDENDSKVNDIDVSFTQPLINGNGHKSLSPPQEYVPVYSPDMGRVRIKLSETPKPQTPILVTKNTVK